MWRYEVRRGVVAGFFVVEIRPSGERRMLTTFEKFEGAAEEAARLNRRQYRERAA